MLAEPYSRRPNPVALGAEARDVVDMVAREGVKMTSIGLGLGAVMLVPILVLIGAVLRGFALDPVTPVTLVWVVLALFVVGTLASVVPATRASRVDPVSVLKTD